MKSTNVIFTLAGILILLGAGFYFWHKKTQETMLIPQEELFVEQANTQEVEQFVQDYLQTMQEHDFDKLKSTYWQPSVLNEIKQTCSSPFGDDGNIATLWQSCQDIAGLQFEIQEVKYVNTTILVWVQFYDEDGSVSGLVIHPEWAAGHPIELIEQEPGRYKTTSWNFFRS